MNSMHIAQEQQTSLKPHPKKLLIPNEFRS